MLLRQWTVTILITAAALLLLASLPAAQGVPGFAEIDSPLEGDALTGIVTIRGTADHPAFASYELAFSYDPNPTDTWFPITDEVRAPVQEDGLALWDTSGITPGRYQLRLTVHAQEGQPIEAFVGGLELGSPVVSPTEVSPTETTAPAEGQDDLADQEELEVENEITTKTPISPDRTLWRLAGLGALASFTLLLAFGLYSALRPRVRDYLGLLRMRQLKRQRRRQRRSEPPTK